MNAHNQDHDDQDQALLGPGQSRALRNQAKPTRTQAPPKSGRGFFIAEGAREMKNKKRRDCGRHRRGGPRIRRLHRKPRCCRWRRSSCWPRPDRPARPQAFRGEELVIEELTEDAFEGVDIALFSAGSGISKHYAPIAVKAGAVVVDNSAPPSAPIRRCRWWCRRSMPAASQDHKGIIANPNCAAITTLVPLWPVHQVNPRQAADRLHLSGGVGRRRGADGGA